MSELKTKPNDGDVRAFIDHIENSRRQKDAYALLDVFTDLTDLEPQMWGDSIIGYGTYHYKYSSGREGDWFLAGFSPRKQNMTLYIMAGFEKYEDLLGKLGKYKTGASCLYINKLSDVDMDVLKELIQESISDMERRDEK